MLTVREVQVRDWQHLVQISDDLLQSAGTWIFRGQREATWGLTTSLDRALADFGIRPQAAERTEVCLVCRFRRQAHHYVGAITPRNEQVLEWLALMQHFGAPTRVQDWTYSFFVAAFFALETASGPSVVWALRRDLLLSALDKKLPGPLVSNLLLEGYKDNAESFTEIFAHDPAIPLVCPVNPYRLNERLSIQQGLFLVPGNISLPFEDNLSASLDDAENNAATTRFVFPGSLQFRSEALARLHGMNINAATLFPGLDGFARSLRTMLAGRSTIPSPKTWAAELQS
ncbi:MAG TPA: FRG domain-containing protein [Pyrinomonadaceae bacterium]